MEKLLVTNDYASLEAVDFNRVVYDKPNDLIYIQTPTKYEFVDLGLSVKWATCNVGATKPEETGLFFQWGDTQGYKVTLGELQNEGQGLYSIESMDPEMKQFTKYFSDYKFYSVENGTFNKYNGLDGLTTLELSDDAANADYSKMRMPTKKECEELFTRTTSAWTDNYNETNVKGCVFTSKVDETKSIFIPAAGAVYDGIAKHVGLYGCLWPSSLHNSKVDKAYVFAFDYIDSIVGYDGRYVGVPVRGVV